MGGKKPKLEVMKVHKYANSGRFLAGPSRDGLYFSLNNDLSFSGKEPHRVKRGTTLETTEYRIEFEVTREGSGYQYRRVRYWDMRHLPRKTDDPLAPLECRIDISPSQGFTDQERSYSGAHSGHSAGYILIAASVFLLWMIGVWGWLPSALSLGMGVLVIWLTRRTPDPAKIREIEAAKQRVRRVAAEEFERALNSSEVWKALDGVGFEQAVAHLFIQEGYEVEHTPRSYDKGVDLVLQKDGKTILVQCKAYSGTVGVKEARELLGAKSQWPHAAEIWIVALHGFTKSAREFAEDNSIKLISIMSDHLRFNLRFENGLIP